MLDFDIIDPHHHFWDLSHSYPWLEGKSDPDRFTGDDSAIRHNYLPADYRTDFASLNLVASVHVDAGAGDSHVEAQWLEEMHETKGLPTVIVVGVRHILNWHADPRFTYTNRDDIIIDPTWRRNFARLAPLGLSFDIQVYPRQLLQAADLAEEFPETTIVLNHTGMPTSTAPDEFRIWSEGIKALAAQPNTSIKISGLGMTDHRWTRDSLRPYVLDSIDAFGVERSMFASNFPVDSLYSDIPTLYGAFDEITNSFSRAERHAMFADTARDIYRISPTLTSRQDVS